MAKIVEHREIPLDELVIGKAQARTHNPGQGVEDLAESIKVQGLLQPIVVCPAQEHGKLEILTGQRRFLAHKYLKRESISAAILDGRVSEGEAKAISITENLMRRNLQGIDLKDGILYLYNLYGSVNDVVDKTGLTKADVQANLAYPRLIPELKKLVDDQTVAVKAALKAQDASKDANGNPNSELAVKLLREIPTMSGVQQKRIKKQRKENPDEPIDEVIEAAKSGSKVTQIITTVTQDTHAAIQKFAAEEKTTQDEATLVLIEDSLVERGFLERES